jgi:hypothetical protein
VGISKLGNSFKVGALTCQWFSPTARFINPGCPRNNTDGCPCNKEHHEYCESTCDVEDGSRDVLITASGSVKDTWQTIHKPTDPANVYRGSKVAFCGIAKAPYALSVDLEEGAKNQKGDIIKKVPGFKPTILTGRF